MGAISHTPGNIFRRPNGSYLRNNRYVYINTSNKYVPPSKRKDAGTRGYTDHDSKCIGVLTDPGDPACQYFYANEYYRGSLGAVEDLPPPGAFADSIAVGLTDWISVAAERTGLINILADVFGEVDAQQILDFSAYMISKESAVMQHYPSWAREHALFSEGIKSDTEIGQFLKRNITISKINLFRDRWMPQNLGDGHVYLCYDSTNVNSQARGVSIVQMGHAKDDATLPQVNSDYVVRQMDGLPLTYLHSPGSVTDISQAQEMISFIERTRALSGKDVSICLICDRGYISEKNLKMMDEAGLAYILMLRSNFGLYDAMTDKAIDVIKTYRNLLDTEDGDEQYGMTEACQLREGGPVCYAQIIWSASRYSSERAEVLRRISLERRFLQTLVEESKNTFFDEKELRAYTKKVPSYFRLQTEDAGIRQVEKKKRGRGQGTKVVDVPVFRITGFEEDEDGINREIQKAGIIILVTKNRMTAQETLGEYAKRDCVEKVFEALKSHLGMDKIGVTTEEAMHGKGFIWFVASILHAILFNGTKSLRATSRKDYTVPMVVDKLEAIKGDKDLTTGQYRRRYRFTSKQGKILALWNIDQQHVDERIESLAQ